MKDFRRSFASLVTAVILLAVIGIAWEVMFAGRYQFPCTPTMGVTPIMPWMFWGGGMWIFPIIGRDAVLEKRKIRIGICVYEYLKRMASIVCVQNHMGTIPFEVAIIHYVALISRTIITGSFTRDAEGKNAENLLIIKGIPYRKFYSCIPSPTIPSDFLWFCRRPIGIIARSGCEYG